MQETKQESSDAILARWYQENLDELRKGKQLALSRQTELEVIRDQVESYKPGMPEWQQDSFKVWVFASRHGWQVSVDLAVDTFKDAIAVNMIEFVMMALGDKATVETDDFPGIGHRDVSFSTDGLEVGISMRLRGDGSEGCRRVKVGTETREVPVYEFKCD